jgi:hypothetical protein
MNVAAVERRAHPEGTSYHFTAVQFWVTLLALVAVMGLTPFGIAKWVVTQAIKDQIADHDKDADSHMKTLIKLNEQRGEMLRTIDRIDTRLDGIEKMLRSIAADGGFDAYPNGRKK